MANKFAEYITAEQAYEINRKTGSKTTLAEWKVRARSKRNCMVCGMPAWRYADTGLCFTCTTGESDASEDYELIAE